MNAYNTALSPREQSQQNWRQTRRYLNTHRHELAHTAKNLYKEHHQIGTTGLLAHKNWIPPAPVPLDNITLAWDPHPPAPQIDGTEPAAASIRPLRTTTTPHARYTDALQDLDPPRLFENRPIYRLLNIHPRPHDYLHLTFGHANYFDSLNVSEAIAHELAAATQHSPHQPPLQKNLPFRSLIGDPCDFHRRPATLAVSTLTIRHNTTTHEASFLLHWRDPKKVAHGGGLSHVTPVGVFQPPTDTPTLQDLNLWHSITREYQEELLGAPEPHHNPTRHTHDTFAHTLTTARNTNNIRAYYLGLGVDPLTMATDLLTVFVFTHTTYDALFHNLTTTNTEGHLLTHNTRTGIPFTPHQLTHHTHTIPIQPAAAALLHLATQHQHHLLHL